MVGAMSGETATCAVCGTQRQFHSLPERGCEAFAPLPDPSAWHREQLPRMIIADIRGMVALSEQFALRYGADIDLSVASLTIGDILVVSRDRFDCHGLVGMFAHRLETLRDEAIGVDLRAMIKARGWGDFSEPADNYFDQMGAHFDTVAQAFEAKP